MVIISEFESHIMGLNMGDAYYTAISMSKI